jgi:hypothetical protein
VKLKVHACCWRAVVSEVHESVAGLAAAVSHERGHLRASAVKVVDGVVLLLVKTILRVADQVIAGRVINLSARNCLLGRRNATVSLHVSTMTCKELPARTRWARLTIEQPPLWKCRQGKEHARTVQKSCLRGACRPATAVGRFRAAVRDSAGKI